MEDLRKLIHAAFASVEYPGDDKLRGSNEGEEPFLLEEEFAGMNDWKSLSAEFIDQAPDGFSSSLSFFSKEAFHFYLAAYLMADLDGKLIHTNPVNYLTHGLTESTKDQSINPRRYGQLTWFEYVSDRFSVFSVEEKRAIVQYLRFRLDKASTDFERTQINQALSNYWEPVVNLDAA
jgi:hypothetical protein